MAAVPPTRSTRRSSRKRAAPGGMRAAKLAPADSQFPRRSGTVRVGKHDLSLTNLDKVLYSSGFTKGQVLDYYSRIAPLMLPYLKGRAVTLKRYPDGPNGMFFYEKNCPTHRPPWVRTESIKGREGAVNFCVIDDAAALLWAANLASLELHVTMAKATEPDRPTMMVFDLDPGPPAGLKDCLRLGLQLRDVLAGVGLDSFPKTSGGKGLHIYVPLNTPGVTFDDTKNFARTVATVLERSAPQAVTATMAKAGRTGKVFVDWSQNDRHKTTACAYSLRARPEPTVSAPVTWDEVARADRRGKPESIVFTAPEMLKRVEKLGDVFAPVLKKKQRLPKSAP